MVRSPPLCHVHDLPTTFAGHTGWGGMAPELTRVCSSCFGSTNSGTRLFTKTQICLSCFGSTNLGHSASFNSSDGLFYLDVWLWFSFPPLILMSSSLCTSAASMEPLALLFSVAIWLKLPSRLKILVKNGTSVPSTHLDQVPARSVGWPVVYFFCLTCL